MAGKHLAGGKFTASHSTTLDATYYFCKWLERQEFVDKISLGVITAFVGSRKSALVALKVQEVPAGVKLTITEKTGAQVVFVYFSISLGSFMEQVKVFTHANKWQWRD